MIRMKERDALMRSIGCKIVQVSIEEKEEPNLYRKVLFHFENGTNLEIFLSAGMMRVTGVRPEPPSQPP